MNGSAPGLRVYGFSWDISATLKGCAVPMCTRYAAEVGWKAKGEPGWLLMGLGVCQEPKIYSFSNAIQ